MDVEEKSKGYPLMVARGSKCPRIGADSSDSAVEPSRRGETSVD